MVMGRVDVQAMLRQMPPAQIRDWMIYEQVEPFGELRADYRAASIRETIHNLAVKKAYRKPVSAFLLKIGEQAEAAQRRQTPEEQSKIMRQVFEIYSKPAMDI